MLKRKAVFLDRDGVLNRCVVCYGKPYPPADALSMRLTEGAHEAVDALKKAGYLCICVTNQPDVARGTRTLDNVQAMNEWIVAALSLDDLLVCLHDSPDNCDCRKPKPGMLTTAAEKWNIDLAASWMVGDRRGDVLAGQAAGCRTVFIDYGYDETKPEAPSHICRSFVEAAHYILNL